MSLDWSTLTADLREALAAGCTPPGARQTGRQSAMQYVADKHDRPYTTVANTIKAMERAGAWSWDAGPTRAVVDTLPDELDDTAERWAQLERRYAKLEAHEKAKASIAIRLPENMPVGVMLFGDTHLDNPGTDLLRARRHRETVMATAGMYTVCLGDILDNWPMGGRLAKLHADTPVTTKEARRLAFHHLELFDDKLLAVVLGNHDAWSPDFCAWLGDRLKCINVQDAGRFRFVFPNAVEVSMAARHRWPGSSQWNTAHAIAKAAQMGDDADLLVGGDLHISGYQIVQHPVSARLSHCVQVCGYKKFDHYAVERGFRRADWMPAAVAILDPLADDPVDRVLVMPSVSRAATYLTSLRAYYAGRKP